MNNNSFKIREIGEKDRESFLAMCRQFYASPAVLHTIPEAYHVRTFDALMAHSPYLRGFILHLDGETAGYGLISLTYSAEAGGMVVWIEELYLLPPFRGKGAAHSFFAWLEENYPAARYRLETEHDNYRAKKLYQALGFRTLEYEQMIKGE